MEIKNIKGTHDIFSKEMEIHRGIINVFSTLATLYDYQEITPPTIEPSELFNRSVGESSDIVRKEMYTFLDKGNRSISLRPEFTASIVRAFVQYKMYATEELPVKFYYHGPAFRYERPQLGRYRQFHQMGVEALGSSSYLVDVEVITLAYEIICNLGLKDYVIVKINSLGDKTSRSNYKEALKDYFSKCIDKMCDDCKERLKLNPLRILDCKVKEDRVFIDGAPKMSDYLTLESNDRFSKLKACLNELEIPFEVDNELVRGLDYYSEVVFELHFLSKNGVDIGAIGAGGHYSNLIKEIGGPELEGVGFSFGVERLCSVLAELDNRKLLDQFMNKLDVYIMPIGDDKIKKEALEIGVALRESGLSCNVCFENSKIGNMFKKAEKKNAKFAVIIGEDEMKNSQVQVKDLINKIQHSVSYDDLVEFLYDSLGYNDSHCHDDECGCLYHGEHDDCSCKKD